MTFMNGTERSIRDWDSLQFRAIFAICWPACLCVALIDRLQTKVQRRSHRSLLAEARDAAGTIARYALAG